MDVLAAQHNWLHYVANRLQPFHHPDHDDIVQEGRIAMWSNIEKYDGRTDKGSLEGWLHMVARRRMLDIAYARKPHLGHEPLRNSWKPPTTSLEELLAVYDGVEIPDVFAAPDQFKDVENAYHRGQLIEGLNQLSPRQREYVVLRFWGGLFEPDSGPPTKRAVSKDHMAISKELAPQFSNKATRTQHWYGAKERLAQYMDNVRTGYGEQ